MANLVPKLCHEWELMDDLIARLEKAKGPDRELDGDIALHLGLVPRGMERGWAGGWAGNGKQFDAAWYTSSTDAALTLVPEGWGWSLDWDGGCSVFREPLSGRLPDNEFGADGPSPAIALCIAALKARADTQARGR